MVPMKRNSLFSLGLILLTLSTTAQVRRIADMQAPSSASTSDPQATPASGAHARLAALQARRAARQAQPFATGPRPAIVVLSTPPVIEHLVATAPGRRSDGTLDSEVIRQRMFANEGQAYAQSLRAAKAPLVAQLQARGVNVMSQTEHVLNAIMISATQADLEWLRTQPGVQSAEFAGIRRIQLNAATTLVGAPAVWNQLGGAANAGKGTRIAIMDSGIDTSEPMLSGSGFTAPSGFPVSSGAQGKTYTNNKVIVARNYLCASTGASTACPNSTTSPNGTSYDHDGGDGFGHGTGTSSDRKS